jgi:pathogenesis-related protein 1
MRPAVARRPGTVNDWGMKRCMTLSRAPSELPYERRGQKRGLSVGLALFASVGLGCLGDDALSDDEQTGNSGATASMGGAASGESSASAGSPSNGGRGGTSGGGSSNGTAGSSGGTGSSTDDTGAAPGETGIFVGMTAAHNAAREALEEGLPALTWSPEIADFSQEWSDSLADACGTIEHRDQSRYGENIAMRGSTRLDQPFAPEEAVDGWVAEVACWDFGTISGTESCDTACVADLNSNGCGHYTQVVWRNTRRVGCGYSTCESGRFTYEIWVCNYDPPGNFIGQTPY